MSPVRIFRREQTYTDADGPYYETVIEFEAEMHDYSVTSSERGKVRIVIDIGLDEAVTS